MSDSDSTTIRVSTATRDDLRRLADDQDVTLDVLLRRLLRRERQRLMGLTDAQRGLSEEEAAIVAGGARQVGRLLVEGERASR